MHDGAIAARAHHHSDAVVVAALIFAELGEFLGIEEIRVRIQRVQHSRNRAVVNGLVRFYLIREILLHRVVDFRERFKALGDRIVRVSRRNAAATHKTRDKSTETNK